MVPAAFTNVPVLVNATDCESDTNELLAEPVASTVKFGVFTDNADVVLVPIDPDATKATV